MKHLFLTAISFSVLFAGCTAPVGTTANETAVSEVGAIETASSAAILSTIQRADGHGNVYLHTTAIELMHMGFAIGDIVTVSIGDLSLEMPFVMNHSDVEDGKNYLQNSAGYLVLGLNQGSFQETYAIDFDSDVTITLKQTGGYLETFESKNPLYSLDVAPDYTNQEDWAYFGEGEAITSFDLFLIAPTTDMGVRGQLNMSIENEAGKQRMLSALNMEKGIYSDTCALYAPYYRQMSMLVYEDETIDSSAAYAMAYEDVANAFRYYLDEVSDGEPIVLAGFSQGSQMELQLLKDFGEEIQDRLVGAYLIGWGVKDSDVSEFVVPAQEESDTGVFVSFNTEAVDVSSSFAAAETEHTVSINPLNWKTDETLADRSLNLGGCFPDGNGDIQTEVPEMTGAYLDPVRGMLKVTDIEVSDYPSSISFLPDGVYHLYDYQFFYRNLQKNVAVRCAAFEN